MSDDMLIHFSSNSSNQSDQSLPTKIAKLEARMVGKGSSTAAQQSGWSSASVPSAVFIIVATIVRSIPTRLVSYTRRKNWHRI